MLLLHCAWHIINAAVKGCRVCKQSCLDGGLQAGSAMSCIAAGAHSHQTMQCLLQGMVCKRLTGNPRCKAARTEAPAGTTTPQEATSLHEGNMEQCTCLKKGNEGVATPLRHTNDFTRFSLAWIPL